MSDKAELIVEGKKLAVSNLNKVLYPKASFTKGQVIDYYIRVAPFLLPHLKDRPLTMKRYPNGVDQPFFYEKNCPAHRPKTLSRALGEHLERAHPKLVIAKMARAARAGKVFVDWSQNDEHKTTVNVYSLRAKDQPTVSTPVTWQEVEAALKKKKAQLLV